MDWTQIKYFKPTEFNSPDKAGSGKTGMDLAFVKKLDNIRMRIGQPIKINSGFRTAAHNKKVGGVPDSAHLRGLAADLSVTDSAARFDIVRVAIDLGIRRIGIGPSIVHLDDDPTLPQEVIWLY